MHQVRSYGRLADCFRRGLEVADAATLGDLRAALAAIDLGIHHAGMRDAIDDASVPDSTLLRPGQEVELMAPLSGGCASPLCSLPTRSGPMPSSPRSSLTHGGQAPWWLPCTRAGDGQGLVARFSAAPRPSPAPDPEIVGRDRRGRRCPLIPESRSRRPPVRRNQARRDDRLRGCGRAAPPSRASII